MNRHSQAVGFLALVFLASGGTWLVSAQSGPTPLKSSQRTPDQEKLTAPSPLSAQAMRGRHVWLQRCALCHDPVSTSTRVPGPWLDREVVRARGEERVR